MVTILVSQFTRRFSDSEINMLSMEMAADEREKLRRFRRWQDVQSTVVGRILLKEGLKFLGINFSDLELRRSEFNKPFFVQGPHFNISHSGDYVVCAISQKKIGIDIEKKVSIVFEDFASQWHVNELSNLQRTLSPADLFFSYWTRKECVIKADGRGLNIPLSHFDVSCSPVVLQGVPWFLHEIEIDNNYSCHAATDTEGAQLEITAVKL